MEVFKHLELYGFSGKMGTGKNYIAEKLFKAMLPPKNTLVVALADHFKIECCVKDNVDYNKVFGLKDDKTRSLLQKRGTEEGRNIYGPNIWINILETWIKRHHETGIERVIVTDLRFPNEVEWLKSLGGYTFRIEAPHRNMNRLKQEAGDNLDWLHKIQNHASETALDNYTNFDYIINNDYQNQREIPNKIRDIVRNIAINNHVAPLTIFCDLDDTICICKKFYNDIVLHVIHLIKSHITINDSNIDLLIKKYISSFEQRYYTREDFSTSLCKVVMEAYEIAHCFNEFNSDLYREVYRLGLSVYDQHYDPLYDDSIARVREMCKYGQVVIFTLGDHTEQMKKIVHLGLLDFKVEIFTHKDENMFRYLKTKYPSKKYVMIGDSYQRDIVPALKANFDHLVHISSKPIESFSDKPIDQIFTTDRLNDDLMNYLLNIKKSDTNISLSSSFNHSFMS